MKKIFIGLAVLIAIVAFAIYKSASVPDKLKIMESYSTLDSEDHVFESITLDELDELILNEDAIVYFGSPKCPTCVAIMPELDRLAKVNNIETVYYVYLDYTSALAGEFQVEARYDYKGTPLIVLFEDGEYVYSNFSYENANSAYYNLDSTFYLEIVKMFENF